MIKIDKLKFYKFFDALGVYSIFGMALTMSISRAFFNIFALFMVVSWLASGRFLHIIHEVKQTFVMLLCIILYVLILFGVSYSISESAWSQALSYSKLLLIPLMFGFIDTKARTKNLWFSLLTGLILLQVIYISDLWLNIPGSHSARTGNIGVFNNHIVEGLSLTVLALVSVTITFILIKIRSWKSIIIAILAGAAIYSVMFLNPGRGAQLSLVVGLTVLIFLKTRKGFRWLGASFAIFIFATIAMQSDMMTQRFEQVLYEAKTSDTVKNTSVGLRINAWRAGLSLWSEKPFLGHGTGSYAHLMSTQKTKMVGGCVDNPVCLQPHSQYVLLLVEQGFIGFLIFLAILGAMVLPAIRSEHIAAKLSAAFACSFAVHSAFDSGLRMGTQMFVFMVMAVALTAAIRTKWPDNG